jgi:hypothetical protein
MPRFDVTTQPHAVPAQRLPPLEELVASIADLVLKTTGLADRYESNLGGLTEPTLVASQQARVRDLRWAADLGRDRLIEIARHG